MPRRSSSTKANRAGPICSPALSGGNIATIPVLGLSFADGAALYQESQAGPVIVHAIASTENDPNRTTVNVIADSPKGKIKGQTVVVGAHLDSVTAGPGINDNGSGSSTILEIAEQMAALKYTKKLQRQVRFAFWGAEENGTLGSEHYVENLTENQRSKIYANLNFDMLGSPNYVRFVYDGNGSDTPDCRAARVRRHRGASSPTTSPTRGWHRNRRPSTVAPTTAPSSPSASPPVDCSAAPRASRR